MSFKQYCPTSFGDIEGVEAVVDDILIWAESDEQHDQILKGYLNELGNET